MKLRIWLSNVFFGVALCALCMYAASMYQVLRPIHVDAAKIVNSDTTKISKPRSIRIASLHLDLPIYQTDIFDTKWQTSSVGVSYLETSPIPGEPGNSILYAHNWPNLFGKLPKLKVGDVIVITYTNNTTKQFHVFSITTVMADDTSILAPTTTPQITLYTCTGLFDTKRTVITAR